MLNVSHTLATSAFPAISFTRAVWYNSSNALFSIHEARNTAVYMLTKQRILGGIAALFGVSLLFAFLGVYDNRHMPFTMRTLFWVCTIGTGVIGGILFLPVLIKGYLSDLKLPIKILVLSAVEVIPTPIAIAAFTGGLSGNWGTQEWLTQYFLSFVIALIINSCAYMYIKSAGWLDGPSLTSESAHSQFMERLPAKYHAAELFAITSQDHYLEVYTNRGKELILMRLSDALKELSNVDGMQTHRSWWVARTGIADSARKNGKHLLVLKSGEKVPISRSYTKAAKEAKLIS